MREIVIASAVRTGVGSFGGTLKNVSAVDLGATVIKEALNRAGLAPTEVDELLWVAYFKLAQVKVWHVKLLLRLDYQLKHLHGL